MPSRSSASATPPIRLSVFLNASRASTRHQLQVGDDVREDLAVLHLARHHRLAHARRRAARRCTAELAQADPVDLVHVRGRARATASSRMATATTRRPAPARRAAPPGRGSGRCPAISPSGRGRRGSRLASSVDVAAAGAASGSRRAASVRMKSTSARTSRRAAPSASSRASASRGVEAALQQHAVGARGWRRSRSGEKPRRARPTRVHAVDAARGCPPSSSRAARPWWPPCSRR